MLGHTAKEFDQELTTLRQRLETMAGRASDQITSAMKALTEKNDRLAEQVISADSVIDDDENEIDKMAMQILATRHPVATDLRSITMALKFVVDVERIGDLAAGIAKRALELNRLPPLEIQMNFTRLADLVQRNLHRAIESSVRRDAEEALAVIRTDVEIDKLNARMFAELIANVAADPTTVTRVIPLSSVCRALERIGDHVKNLAEEVIFMVRGTDVRHRPIVPTN